MKLYDLLIENKNRLIVFSLLTLFFYNIYFFLFSLLQLNSILSILFSLFYWIIIIFLVVFINSKKYFDNIIISPMAFIFIFSFLYLMIWIPFGIDMTDEGKQMSIGWNIFHGIYKHNLNIFKAGSWYINGLWLSIAGKPFLIWARIGGVIIMSAMTCLSYAILKRYYDGNYTLFIVITALIFIICENHPETKIDHSNFPVLLILISLLFMLLYLRPGMDYKGHYIFNVFACLFILISIPARGPHVFFLIFPLIFYLISLKTFKIGWKNFLIAVLSFYLPVIIILITGAVYLKLKNKFDMKLISEIGNTFFNFSSSFNKILSLKFSELTDPHILYTISYQYFLLFRYLKDTLYILIISVIMFISLYISEYIFNMAKERIKENGILMNIVYLLTGVLVLIFLMLKPWMWYMGTSAFVISYLVMVLIKKQEIRNEFFYIFWGTILIYLSFAGSNNSYRHSFPSGAVFILIPMIALINHARKKELIKNNLIFLNKFTYIFFIVLLVFSFGKKIINDNKRDSSPLYTRNTMFKTRELFLIYSTGQRVKAVDELVKTFRNYADKKSSLLCFNSIPMFYYILDKDYFLGDPWLIPYGYVKTKAELEEKASRKVYPDFIIFSKTDARDFNWPDTFNLSEKKDMQLYEYIKLYIKQNGYRLIFENQPFLLYKRY